VTSTLTFTSDNWSSAQTFTVTGVNDADEIDETVTISHAVSGGGYDSVIMANFTATMTDDDFTSESITSLDGTSYKTVQSPYTGKIWLDRNLGATQVCTSSTHAACYGNYYQWGRDDDGHESSSGTSSTLASSVTAAGTKFITINDDPRDWTTDDSDGVIRSAAWADSGANDICPVGFRVPTKTELTADTTLINEPNNVTDNATAYSSFLKLPAAGYRHRNGAGMMGLGSSGRLWSSSASGPSDTKGDRVYFGASTAGTSSYYRADGFSVRCLKD
jgi:uncharacterized protein (TIGR02145 family)